MLTHEQNEEVTALAKESLDLAEATWNQVGHEFSVLANRRENMKTANESLETNIPGYPRFDEGKPQVDDFIAIVADMRGSTQHLLQAISSKIARVTGLQRVFYETSAVLPCLAKAISFENGSVTEYLGDGVLGLFLASDDRRPDAIYSAHNAAKKCLTVVSGVINPILADRYSLPEIEIGVGLSFSKAVVTAVGLDGHREAKVFGKCVYYASKLSGGRNEIFIDEALKVLWPTSDGGALRFVSRKVGEVDGYLVTRSLR